MLDAAPTLQRSFGETYVQTRTGPDGATRLARLRQAGCAKAMLPRVHSSVPEIVCINTAGGLTGGDRFDVVLDIGARGTAVATSQAAERIYASAGGSAQVDVGLQVGANASLDWLPQETILFEGGALDRRTTVRLGEGARVLMLETLVLGRAAMGETLREVSVIDRRRIEDARGRPIFHEALGLDARALDRRDAAAGLAGARAVSTLVLAGAGAADRLDAVRRVLGDGPDAAASVAQGVLIVRLRAKDAHPMRNRLIAVLACLRAGPLPRVWQI